LYKGTLYLYFYSNIYLRLLNSNVFLGFHCSVNEVFALLRHYTAFVAT
jgi:hypothetical protein